MKMLLIAASVIAGCLGGDNHSGAGGAQVSPGKARYLCVGMEMSARFGSCPGCAVDATQLSWLMRQMYGYSGETLISEQATKDAIVSRLKAGIESTPEDGLFLFLYSGHGGQEYLGGTEPDGADRMDEYLCFYDRHMMDDELWEIVSKCKGRVFLYFDACHSETMFRSVARKPRATGTASALGLATLPEDIVSSHGFTFAPAMERRMKATALSKDSSRSGNVRIMCWSGCKEIEYSYGGNKGGYMTICLLKGWKKGLTYSDLWESVRAGVKKMEPTQNPVMTVLGEGFNGVEAFR